jgi:FAD:protein FMN transferase
METDTPTGCSTASTHPRSGQRVRSNPFEVPPRYVVFEVSRRGAGPSSRFPGQRTALFDLYDQLHAMPPRRGWPCRSNTGTTGIRQDLIAEGSPRACAKRRTCHAASLVEGHRRYGARLHFRRPFVIDIGAAGKGYLIDIVTNLLQRAGFRPHVVDVGGNIRNVGRATMHVGLEHRFVPCQVIGIACLVCVGNQPPCVAIRYASRD